MTPYESVPLAPALGRVRRHLLLLILLLIILLTGVALGYHLLELRQVAEAALTGLVGLAINVRSVRL